MRQEFPARIKAAAALRADGKCESCTRKLMTGDYHYDHEIPDQLGGQPTLENCKVLCKSCHGTKTAKTDIPRIAKAKRNFNAARGIRKRSKFACSRTGKWRKKINGTVELR